MQLIKVAWYVFRVKNMHPRSPSDPSWTATAEAKPRCVYSILKPHGQSSRYQVRALPPRRSRGTYTHMSEFHHLPRVGPKQLCALAQLGCIHAAGTPSVFYFEGCSETISLVALCKVTLYEVTLSEIPLCEGLLYYRGQQKTKIKLVLLLF